jgi:hypothetical protein
LKFNIDVYLQLELQCSSGGLFQPLLPRDHWPAAPHHTGNDGRAARP